MKPRPAACSASALISRSSLAYLGRRPSLLIVQD
jgi:hypothetical protein